MKIYSDEIFSDPLELDVCPDLLQHAIAHDEDVIFQDGSSLCLLGVNSRFGIAVFMFKPPSKRRLRTYIIYYRRGEMGPAQKPANCLYEFEPTSTQ